jgi:arylsulfatase A-like enzyme
MCSRLTLAVAAAGFVSASRPPRPNFLILFPDQWRYDWTTDNAALAANLSMPTWTSIRSKGTHFTKAFVPSPLCAPSRACLASGREYDFAGVPDNFSNDYPVNITTFYTLLRDAGYEVMTSGKDDLTKASGPSINGSYHAAALGFTSYARCDGKDDATGPTPHDP